MASGDADPRLRGDVRDYVGYVEVTPGPLRRREVPSADDHPHHQLRPGDRGGRSRRRGRSGAAVTRRSSAGLHDAPCSPSTPAISTASRSGSPRSRRGGSSACRCACSPTRSIALEDLLGRDAERLVERLYEAPGWARASPCSTTPSPGAWPPRGRRRPGVAWAWGRLRETHGALPIGTLAGELGWSRRHLAAQFREQVGVPPKLLARILRFDRVIALLRQRRSRALGRGRLRLRLLRPGALQSRLPPFAGSRRARSSPAGCPTPAASPPDGGGHIRPRRGRHGGVAWRP